MALTGLYAKRYLARGLARLVAGRIAGCITAPNAQSRETRAAFLARVTNSLMIGRKNALLK